MIQPSRTAAASCSFCESYEGREADREMNAFLVMCAIESVSRFSNTRCSEFKIEQSHDILRKGFQTEDPMADSPFLRSTSAGVTLALRAQPGAKKTAITGVYGEGETAQLKIAIQAPPIEGRANEALIAFLASTFDLPKSSIEIVSGASSRSKVFLMRGVTLERAESALSI